MLKKSFLSFILLLFSIIPLKSIAQLVVTATGTNGTCLSNASISASITGNGSDPVNFELLQNGSVIRNYQASSIFNNLPAGTGYIVQAQDTKNSTTSQSSSLSLTTSYIGMSLMATNTQVESCLGASDGALNISVSGGTSPYTYSLSGPKTLAAQSSNIFNGLPNGTYTVTVVDACGVNSVITTDVALEPYLISSIILQYSSAFIAYQNQNNCSSPLVVGIYGWLNSSDGALTPFELGLYKWAYEYPSGSGKIYGIGGVLGAPPAPLTTQSLPIPATATYPYTYGDIIIYDNCGNTRVLNQALYPSIPQSSAGINGSFESTVSGTYDCTNGPGVNIYISQTEAICYPVTYTFTDQTTGTILTEIAHSSVNTSFYGFTAGHTYSVVSTDGLGHRANWYYTDLVTIPTTAGGFALTGLETWNNTAGYNEGLPLASAPVALPGGTVVTYTVTASNNPLVPIGYTNTSTYPYLTPDILLNGPKSDNSWPAGTYTIQIAGSCYSSTNTFTIVGYTGSFNGIYTETPTCNSFTLGVQATIPNNPINFSDIPSDYLVTILSGPSNIGTSAVFSSAPISPNVYSASFPGLAYGTYTLGLSKNGAVFGPSTFGQETVTYNAINTVSIDAATTVGFVCSGNTTGSLTIHASTTNGTALQYSIDNGASFQASNEFNGLSLGTYPVAVRDGCGNIATYLADVLPATGLNITTTSNTPCLGSTLNLNANVAGAISFSWTGPNGFTSSVQSPSIPNINAASAGTYSVTVITPICTLTGSVIVSPISIPNLIITNPKAVCYPNKVNITDSSVYKGSSPNLNYSYFLDSAATKILVRPDSISLPGKYYIQASNVNGCSVILPVLVSILNPPIASINYPGQPYCGLGSAMVNQTGVSGGKYSSSPGLSLDPNTGTINLAASSPGSYTVTYSFSNASCSNTTSALVQITGNASLSNAGPNQNLCNLSTATLSGNIPSLGMGTWTLVSGPNAPTLANPSLNNSTVTGLIPGTYIFQWTISNFCSSSSSQVSIQVYALPSLSNAGTNQNLSCTSGSTILSGNIPTIGTGTWTQLSGPNIANLVSPGLYNTSVNGLIPGIYIFQWGISNGNCTASTSTVQVQVPMPIIPKVLSQSNVLCYGGNNGSLTLSASGGNGTYTYSIDGINYQSSNIFTSLSAGTYSIQVKDGNGCISSGLPVNLNQPNPIVLMTHAVTVVSPNYADITQASVTTGSSSGLSFSYFTDSLGLIPLINPNSINKSGTYYIKGTNGSGCSTISPVLVTVNPVAHPMADLKVVITGPTSQSDGNPIHYTVIITNQGPITAHNVVLTNALPKGVNFIDTTLKTSGGKLVYSALNATINLQADSLLPGQSITLTYSVMPTVLGKLTNTASVTGSDPDPDLTNNTFSLTTDYELENVVIPTVFMPNGSSINNVFEIGGLEFFPNNSIEIYNRWGNMVYRMNGYGIGGNWWDGSGLNDGTYYYILKFMVNGNELVKAGYTTILRKSKNN